MCSHADLQNFFSAPKSSALLTNSSSECLQKADTIVLVLTFLSYVTSGFANEHSQRGIVWGKLFKSAYFIVLPITNNCLKLNRLLLGICYLCVVPACCIQRQYCYAVSCGRADIYSLCSLPVMITTECMRKL